VNQKKKKHFEEITIKKNSIPITNFLATGMPLLETYKPVKPTLFSFAIRE